MNRDIIKTVKRNWAGIERAMLLSKETKYNWEQYSQIISSGLSSASYNKPGNGLLLWFVEHMPILSRVSDLSLTSGYRLNQEEIDFINKHKEFLSKVN